MKRRLYFVLPDLSSAKKIVDELLLARIEDRHMHFHAKDGVSLEGLHQANLLQTSDIVHGAESGLVVGGVAGVMAGIAVMMFPPTGVSMQLVTILITAVLGSVFGLWVSSMIASSIPNSRLREFEEDLEAGKILLMVDVPATRVTEIRDLFARRHPEAVGGSQEATIPAFP